MEKIVHYFSERTVLANMILFGLIISAIMMWPRIGKEEMPEFAFNWVRVTIPFPGASSSDVELFITKPVEEKLKGVSALEEVTSTSAYGMSSFQVSFELNTPDLQEKIQEVKDAVESVELPREAEEPSYRQFRSSEKAIIDIGLYLKGIEILDTEARIKLQKLALAFKDQLISLKDVSGLSSTGYLQPELQVQTNPEKLDQFEISMAQVQEQIRQQHIRRPIGSMKDRSESDVSLVGELNDVASLQKVIVSSGFDGRGIKLSEVAEVKQGFEKSSQVVKVSGNEGLLFNVQKSSSVDILTAQKSIMNFVEQFKNENEQTGLAFVLMDDESYEVRNRLSIILYNGSLGFILILLVLFLFLDFRAGIWVGMGIPFCLAFTLIGASLFGFTINNITLASVIIVLGIVVDDAIIIAENISRREIKGLPSPYVKGTLEVMNPVLASVLTTCVAFIPLYYFSGRFGLFVKYIPTIVFLMLIASLLESFFLLPAHMRQKLSLKTFQQRASVLGEKRKVILAAMENKFQKSLRRILDFRILVISVFVTLLMASWWLFDTRLNFVLFPREESKDFRVKVKVEEGFVRYETARKIREIEDVFLNDPHNVIVGVRSSIGQSSRGGQVKENEATLIVEVIPRDERDITLNELFAIWQKQFDAMEGFKEIRLIKSRWGSDSGSPIEIQVRENDDEQRKIISERLKVELESISELSNVEIERPLVKPEYQLNVNKREVSRLKVDYTQLAATLRSYVEGTILYTINSGEEEVDVRFTSHDGSKRSIEEVLSLSVANKEGYLIPVRNLVSVESLEKPANISRINFKRTTVIYADIKPESELTPLNIAEYVEQSIFPKLRKDTPSVVFEFTGEVKDSRESQSDFTTAISLALLMIYVLLVFLFSSLLTPLVIAAIIPFGMVGVVFMFWTHGMTQFGFFAVVGALGMIGVVVNDSIVMVDKMEGEFENFLKKHLSAISKDKTLLKPEMFVFVSELSATRLRAIILTTLTTVCGLVPTAYGVAGYDAMLAEMMLSMAWGLMFGMFITLFLTPCLYSFYMQHRVFLAKRSFVQGANHEA